MGILGPFYEPYIGSLLTHFKMLTNELLKSSMPGVTAGSGDKDTTLIKALLNQRPKRVSHLLKDNLPGNSKFYLCMDSPVTGLLKLIRNRPF